MNQITKEDKIKHLEFIQNIVTRMSMNSFILKGWSVTLATGIVILALNNEIKNLIFAAFIPVFIFWGLDAYYLKQERLFRKLYDGVRLNRKEIEAFSLDTTLFDKGFKQWIRSLFSPKLFVLHFGIMLILILTLILGWL